MRLLRYYVFSVPDFYVEAWVLTEPLNKRLEAFRMWLYQRTLRVPWTERVADVEILRNIKKSKEVLTTVKTRKLQYLGHIMSNSARYHLLQSILQSKIAGKRIVGRKIISWLEKIKSWPSETTTELLRAELNTEIIAKIVTIIRNG